ncbi:MAG: ribonuclease J [Pseudomonadota bacterium]
MQQQQQQQQGPGLRVIPLGGLGEIGLNMMVFECGEEMLMIDAGLMFPEDYMLGIDVVIPDTTYVRANKEKLRGIVLTHGHEDHIGAIPFIVRDFPRVPIYGTRLTLELVRGKLREHGLLDDVELRLAVPRETISVGRNFQVEMIRVSHSIVDGVGLAIRTPLGVLIHSGDFKIDQTPTDGGMTDIAKFAEYGEAGVLALLSDSTNVEREGYTISEKEIGLTFERIFRECEGRIIVAVFSSNLERIQQVINVAAMYDRKVLFSGKSMLANVGIAKDLGYVKIPENTEITSRDLGRLHDEEIVLITTGSQGEPMSALSRIAMDDHRQIKIKAGDTVILSSKFIPGNERAIANIINQLYRRGAEVIYEKVSAIHTSGHANQEELKLMINLTRPRYFVPIHGEYRHLIKHKQLARKVGLSKEHILLAEDGDVIEFTTKDDHTIGGRINGQVDIGRVYVDGKGVGDVGAIVLRDRRHLSEDGMLIAVMVVNGRTGELMTGPDLVTQGFVFEEESAHILDEARKIVFNVATGAGNGRARAADGEKAPPRPILEIEAEIRRSLKKYFFKVIERRPLILPIIIEM